MLAPPRDLYTVGCPAGFLLMLLHAVGMVCGLGAVIFATGVRDRKGAAALAAGFAAAAVWLRPEPVLVGGIAAGAAALSLARPRRLPGNLIDSAVAGLLGGLWGHVLTQFSLPPSIAWPLAAAVVGAAAFLSRRQPGFAPLAVREDARLAHAFLAVLVAAWPAVSTGWSAASAMNLESEETVRAAVQAPVAIGLAALVSLGGLHALWRRA